MYIKQIMAQSEVQISMQNNAPIFDVTELAKCLSDAYETSNAYKSHAQKIESLYELAERDNVDMMMVGRYSIYIDMICDGKIVKCMFDTGAQQNVITAKAVEKLGLHDCVDTSYAGKDKMHGIAGSIDSKGFIPYLSLSLSNYTFPTCFTVLPTENEWDCLIGILFMRFYGVSIDFDKNQLHICEQCVPFRLSDK